MEDSNTSTTLHDWLTLAHTPGIGPTAVSKLLGHFNGPAEIFSASAASLLGCGLTPAQTTNLQAIRTTRDRKNLFSRTDKWLQNPYNHIINRLDTRYPQQLLELPGPPTVLYISGDPEVLGTPAIAVVGSRKSAPPALLTTERLVTELATRGITITSGLARGIDFAAHRATLSANGLTIAVAGTGLDRVYPAAHRSLAQEIAETGALVSEFPLGSGPLAHHFPRRNRIISGLSLGVVVIEAALKSGSLITARHAAEQGRGVMALPGSVNNKLAMGTNELIRQGAILVQNADDILEEIAPQIDTDPRITSGSHPGSLDCKAELATESVMLLDCLGYDPATVDTLISRSGSTVGAVTARLLELELQGEIVSLSGGRYARC